ncbi:capsular biosynthesis protein [Lactococcus formosensis]|uniref:capsular biosynthesis protein n=1 Tax=Lactococcus formosensis TaxID=1281486 RepID=UPI00254C20AF|nr:capsular biosynthesis protein [Lactococcus formosensis]
MTKNKEQEICNLVMDIDNTITEKKGNKEYIDLLPKKGVIEKMREYKNKGYHITLQTARQMRTYEGQTGKIMKNTVPVLFKWLEKWDVPYDELIIGKPWNGHKGFYVDDNAIRPSEFLSLSEDEIHDLLNKE